MLSPVLSVVVPCHDEEGNLRPLAAAIARAVGQLGLSWELVVTNDCSTDGSWRVLTELAAADSRIRGQRLARNSGQSAALWAGIASARGRLVATKDADLQNAPDHLPMLLAALESCDCGAETHRRQRAAAQSGLVEAAPERGQNRVFLTTSRGASLVPFWPRSDGPEAPSTVSGRGQPGHEPGSQRGQSRAFCPFPSFCLSKKDCAGCEKCEIKGAGSWVS